jgi:ABC-type multidrug transport system permease subunit
MIHWIVYIIGVTMIIAGIVGTIKHRTIHGGCLAFVFVAAGAVIAYVATIAGKLP